MIFLDTNVVVDLLNAEPSNASRWSLVLLEMAAARHLVCNHIVLAEVAAGGVSAKEVLGSLTDVGIEIAELTNAVAIRAGAAYGEYRRRGGAKPRILPDFLIASHAVILDAALATRDRRLRSYFPELTFLTPEAEND